MNPSGAPDGVLDMGDLEVGAVLVFVRAAIARLEDGQTLDVMAAGQEAASEIEFWCARNHVDVLARSQPAANRFQLRLRRMKGSLPARPDWDIKIPPRGTGAIDMRDWLVGRTGEVPDVAPLAGGFVPRGAVAEEGIPDFPYELNLRVDVWANNVSDLYEQARAQQWNASTDIAWGNLPALPDEMERSVCQLMTFLAENEYSALYIPAKFIPRINAQFAEVVLFLSTVISDEARHIEAFTKRALANGGGLQYAAALTEWSLRSLLLQEDYFRSGFLLHVLGEGTFLDLLDFIASNAPDEVTRDVVRHARIDEGRHVAYGIAHVREQIERDPVKADELVDAAEERAAVLQATSGDNPLIIEALSILAGRGSKPEQLGRGLDAVHQLYEIMHTNRIRRMTQIGLSPAVATRISDLHTPNFM